MGPELGIRKLNRLDLSNIFPETMGLQEDEEPQGQVVSFAHSPSKALAGALEVVPWSFV